MFKPPKKKVKAKRHTDDQPPAPSSRRFPDRDGGSFSSSSSEDGGGGRGRRRDANDEGDDDDDDDEEEEEEEEARRRRRLKANRTKKDKKKKRKRGMTFGGAMSFDPDEGDLDVEDGDDGKRSSKKAKKESKKENRKKKKKRKQGSGIGYGGFVPSLHDDEEEEEGGDGGDGSSLGGIGSMRQSMAGAAPTIDEVDEDHKEKNGENSGKRGGGGSMYDADALARLRSEQKSYVVPQQKQDEPKPPPPSVPEPPESWSAPQSAAPVGATITTMTGKAERDVAAGGLGGDYVSLSGSGVDGSGGGVVLTGDEALSYADDGGGNVALGAEALSGGDRRKGGASATDGDVLLGTTGGNDDDADVDEGGRRWEEEVERRAGLVRGPQTTRLMHPTVAGGGGPSVGDNGAAALSSTASTASAAAATTTSLAAVKSSLCNAIANLGTTSSDLESSLRRRNNELDSTRDELKRHESELRKNGDAFEYYQNLRVDLVQWVGALRDLDCKLTSIEDGVAALEAECSGLKRKRRREREDDTAAALKEVGLLDGIIGRGASSTTAVASGAEGNGFCGEGKGVDEFGRDLSTMASLARSRRTAWRSRVLSERRKRRRGGDSEERTVGGGIGCAVEQARLDYEDSDADASDAELDDRSDRRRALCDAVQLVLNDVDEDFKSLPRLVETFREFEGKYPEEYQRCYANLSLVDLAGVLIRAEICDQMDLLGLQRGEEDAAEDGDSTTCIRLTDFCWFHDLSNGKARFDDQVAPGTVHTAATGAKIAKSSNVETEKGTGATDKGAGYDNEPVLQIALRKYLLPQFANLMGKDGKDGGYDPFSSRQSHSASLFYASVVKNIPLRSPKTSIEELAVAVVDCIRRYVNDISLPLVKPDTIKKALVAGFNDEDDEIIDAISFASFGQALCLAKLVENITTHWVPTLEGSRCKNSLAALTLMDVIAGRLLPLLKCWGDALAALDASEVPNSATPTKVLDRVWFAVKKAGWLEVSDLMLQAAPLRAAAKSHSLT